TLHFFLVPFYYIEYGLAQLGAVQVWRNAEADPAGALASYKSALTLGGTVGVRELYSAAGARFAFDTPLFRDAVGTVERLIAKPRWRLIRRKRRASSSSRRAGMHCRSRMTTPIRRSMPTSGVWMRRSSLRPKGERC